jgi:dihydrofolate reductase
MRRLIYSMGVSLDGYIADPAGGIDWSAPDEELHRFHNDQMRDVDVHLCGRRLYETMVYWETADQDPHLSEHELEFARIWQGIRKVVLSSTLDSVTGNATLLRSGLTEVLARLKQQPGRDLAVGGAALASTLVEQRLIDDYRLFVSPVVLGGGTPYFPSLESALDLELEETRVFGSRVVYLRYLNA